MPKRQEGAGAGSRRSLECPKTLGTCTMLHHSQVSHPALAAKRNPASGQGYSLPPAASPRQPPLAQIPPPGCSILSLPLAPSRSGVSPPQPASTFLCFLRGGSRGAFSSPCQLFNLSR